MLTEVIAGLLAGYRGREPTPAVLPCDWAVIVIILGVIPPIAGFLIHIPAGPTRCARRLGTKWRPA
jgi:hypothetical protein